MSDLIYLKITGEHQGNISSDCGTYASVGNRWQENHPDEIFAFSLSNGLVNTDSGINAQLLNFTKLIDKSTPLLINAINNNERLFIEIDLWRINRFGKWERYYYIQLRNALVKSIQTYVILNKLDTEEITVSYDYILCKHLIANTEFDYLAFPAEYNRLFIPPRPQPVSTIKPIVKRPSPPAPHIPAVTPVYAKSCLKEKGCTDAGSREESAENFGQMAVFAQSSVDDCCGYAQPAEASAALPILGGLTQVWGEWSLGGILSAARGALYRRVGFRAVYSVCGYGQCTRSRTR